MAEDDIDYDMIEKLMELNDLKAFEKKRRNSSSPGLSSDCHHSEREESEEEERRSKKDDAKKNSEKATMCGEHNERCWKEGGMFEGRREADTKYNEKYKQNRKDKAGSLKRYDVCRKDCMKESKTLMKRYRENKPVFCTERNADGKMIKEESRSRSRSRNTMKKKAKSYYSGRSSNCRESYNVAEMSSKWIERDLSEKSVMRMKGRADTNEKKIEEARRDDLTVLVINLSLKAAERDIYLFFSEHAGKVRDVQCIKDQRSGKFKGVAYVEFYTQQSVSKALSLTGEAVCGKSIKVQTSQAEKNRAAKVAKLYCNMYRRSSDNDDRDHKSHSRRRRSSSSSSRSSKEGPPMRIYVAGFVENLSNITESDLKALFSPFGAILNIDLQKVVCAGKPKAYGFIEYSNASDARDAVYAMNGFKVAGRPIKVALSAESLYDVSEAFLAAPHAERNNNSCLAAPKKGLANHETHLLVRQNAFSAKQTGAGHSGCSSTITNDPQNSFFLGRQTAAQTTGVARIRSNDPKADEHALRHNHNVYDDHVDDYDNSSSEEDLLFSDATTKFLQLQKLHQDKSQKNNLTASESAISKELLIKVNNNKNAAGVFAQAKALADIVITGNKGHLHSKKISSSDACCTYT